MNHIITGLIITLCCSTPVLAAANNPLVGYGANLKIDNGNLLPIMGIRVTVNAGTAQAACDKQEIPHIIEHILSDRLDDSIESRGFIEHSAAYTKTLSTEYLATFNSQNIKDIEQYVSQFLDSAPFTQDDIEQQKEIIVSEKIYRSGTLPTKQHVYVEIIQSAFNGICGRYQSGLDVIDAEDLNVFYNRYYRNALSVEVALAGDVLTPVIDAIKRQLNRLKPKAATTPNSNSLTIPDNHSLSVIMVLPLDNKNRLVNQMIYEQIQKTLMDTFREEQRKIYESKSEIFRGSASTYVFFSIDDIDSPTSVVELIKDRISAVSIKDIEDLLTEKTIFWELTEPASVSRASVLATYGIPASELPAAIKAIDATVLHGQFHKVINKDLIVLANDSEGLDLTLWVKRVLLLSILVLLAGLFINKKTVKTAIKHY